jgi:hypothetical protein
MFARSLVATVALAGLAVAAPAPQVSQIVDGQVQVATGSPAPYTAAAPAPAGGVYAENQSGNLEGYTDADAPFVSAPTPLTVIPTTYGSVSPRAMDHSLACPPPLAPS